MAAASTLVGRDISLRRRGGFELDVAEIAVDSGSTLALLGPSGSGKTTLLRILGLLEGPRSGQVLLSGRPVRPGDRDARLRMAAVFQRPYLFKGSVGANVEYGLKLRHVPSSERRTRVAAALERVGLSGYEGHSASHLSGGEAQRVSLARALVLEPEVLFLDEPLASLDPVLKRRLSREFSEILHDNGAAVIWVTHDQDEALTAADHIAVMREGRVVSHGLAEEVSSLPADPWTASFLDVPEGQTGTVTESSEGLMLVETCGASVALAGVMPVGTVVRFAVRPEDVMLFEPELVLPATSARNRLHARVVSVERRGTTDHVRLDADGLSLAASVSRAASRELRLAPGADVLALFKATVIRWRVEGEAVETVSR